MTNQEHISTRLSEWSPTDRRATPKALVGGLVFFLGFVGIILAGQLNDVPLPLPGSAEVKVYAYFREQTLAVVTNAVLQGVSALGLIIFLSAVIPRLARISRTAGVRLCRILGVAAVLSLVLSALTSVALAVLASQLGAGTVATLQQVGFVLGGVTHVVILGALIWSLARTGNWAVAIRRFGVAAAVPAVLSVLSVVLFPASVLLPLGRVLCMVWSISAGTSLLRGRSLPARGSV